LQMDCLGMSTARRGAVTREASSGAGRGSAVGPGAQARRARHAQPSSAQHSARRRRTPELDFGAAVNQLVALQHLAQAAPPVPRLLALGARLAERQQIVVVCAGAGEGAGVGAEVIQLPELARTCSSGSCAHMFLAGCCTARPCLPTASGRPRRCTALGGGQLTGSGAARPSRIACTRSQPVPPLRHPQARTLWLCSSAKATPRHRAPTINARTAGREVFIAAGVSSASTRATRAFQLDSQQTRWAPWGSGEANKRANSHSSLVPPVQACPPPMGSSTDCYPFRPQCRALERW
jgi:hypothetical protein